MAVNLNNILGAITQGGGLLGGVLNQHSSASQMADQYITVIEQSINNPDVVRANANLLSTCLAATNPQAAGLAKVIEMNPGNVSLVLGLAAQIHGMLMQQSGNILSTLGTLANIAGAGSLIFNPGTQPSLNFGS